MSYRQKAYLGCDSPFLLVVASIAIVANCGLIRVAAYRSALAAHQPNYHGDKFLAADNTNRMSIHPISDSNPWWRHTGRYTNINGDDSPSARRDEQRSFGDDHGAVVQRNTGRSVSSRFRGTCGLAPRNPITGDRIWNGETQKYGEWPSYVFIILVSLNPIHGVTCGGTLVSDRHVLTAAHCVYLKANGVFRKFEPSEVLIFHAVHSVGQKSKYQRGSLAKSICVPNGYDPVPDRPGPHDWTVIELDEPIEFSYYIQPACLPEEHVQTKGENSECWVVGTGLMRTHPFKVKADYVQKLPVEQVPCNPLWEIDDEFRACYANYDEPVGNVCSGDSGGPVLCLDNQNRWTVVAVVSVAMNCTDEYPYNILHRIGAVYTDMKVLLNHMKAQCHI